MTKKSIKSKNKSQGRKASRKNTGKNTGKTGKTGKNTQNHAVSGKNWIWGVHAACAALQNPHRRHHKLFISAKMAEKLPPDMLSQPDNVQIITMGEFDNIFGPVSHQGIALKCSPLEPLHTDDIDEPEGMIIVLDQITDPHNVGAIFRLAAAFGAKAIIMQTRNAPPLYGALAKVAVGMIEKVPHIYVTNIANTLLELQKTGWRVTGLAGETKLVLEQALINTQAEVLVMGAEGPGLRKRVRDCCDQLAKIPMSDIYNAESLNVATAAAIAMYETARAIKGAK